MTLSLQLSCRSVNRVSFLSLFLLFALPTWAEPETWYAEKAQQMHGGEIEVRIFDGSRVDLLTDTYAFEIEKSHKWREAIGKSLHHALLTGRKAGIILAMEKKTAPQHLKSLEAVIEAYELPIEVFEIRSLF